MGFDAFWTIFSMWTFLLRSFVMVTPRIFAWGTLSRCWLFRLINSSASGCLLKLMISSLHLQDSIETYFHLTNWPLRVLPFPVAYLGMTSDIEVSSANFHIDMVGCEILKSLTLARKSHGPIFVPLGDSGWDKLKTGVVFRTENFMKSINELN